VATGLLRLGIDVGGTNTDSVLMLGRTVIETNKAFTTNDVASGVVSSVTQLLEKSNTCASEVSQVMIGTTQFINAFIQRRSLASVAVIRAALPKGDGVPPLVMWPGELLSSIGRNVYQVNGGANFDGSCYAEIDEHEIRTVADDLRRLKIASVAVSTPYASLRPDIELNIEQILVRECPEISVTRSGAVGGLGLIDRENAAVINASLVLLARHVVSGLRQAFSELGIDASYFISQNDGTLISTEEAAKYPIFTCAAGPTNSIRGAAFLSGLADAVVVDIGGTTTDIGFVAKGFPRESALPHFIGGIRTNMRMPDVLSLPLGGGSEVLLEGKIRVGPRSVGHKLSSEALAFGGKILTASDIAIAAGAADFGDRGLLEHLEPKTVQMAMARMARIVEDGIDGVKTSSAPVPVVLVGGGSVLIPHQQLGENSIIRPKFAEVANAVGAAIATVSGRVDKMYNLADIGRDAAIAQARGEAIQAAIDSGADPATVEILELLELPMTHIRASACQIRVRAVGELALDQRDPRSTIVSKNGPPI